MPTSARGARWAQPTLRVLSTLYSVQWHFVVVGLLPPLYHDPMSLLLLSPPSRSPPTPCRRSSTTGCNCNSSRPIPTCVTPTGIAVDDQGRVLVIESHTHFRPDGLQRAGARSHSAPGRLRSGDRQGPQDQRLLRGDDAHDEPGRLSRRLDSTSPRGARSSASATTTATARRRSGRASATSKRPATIRTTACRASRSTSPATSTSASARTWGPTTS